MSGPVSVVIPNWNGLRFLPPIFEDLRAQSLPPAEIVLVDNGSEDGSARWAQEHGARVVQMGSNRGFAPAVNRGVAEAAGSLVAVLNNDLRLDAQWIRAAVEGIAEGAFAVGKTLQAAHRDRIDGTYDAVCRGGTAWRCGAGFPDGALWATPREVLFPPFTAVLLRRDRFVETGGLDETLESYLEDVEFGLRSASLGYTGRYVPEAVSYHLGSATLGAWHSRTVRQIARNQLLIVSKHYTGRMLRRFGWRIAVAQLLWGALAVRHGTGGAWLAGKVEGLRRFRAMRGSGSERLERILESSEAEIRDLQRRGGMDAYWRLYFALT